MTHIQRERERDSAPLVVIADFGDQLEAHAVLAGHRGWKGRWKR